MMDFERAPRVLVVEDDTDIAEVLQRSLRLEGYEVRIAGDGRAGLDEVHAFLPDVVILDLGLPMIDGIDVARALRREEDTVPILMLTARDALEARVAGLDAGADDYLVKPFDVEELKARLRALLRRSGPERNGGEDLSFAEIRLDSERHGAAVGDEFAELTRTEYQLLELLMRNPRRVLPHSLIYDRVWGYDFGAASNALRVYVGYLRRKLEVAGARPLIHTVRGVGYVLREP